jgi:hypothetical protein
MLFTVLRITLLLGIIYVLVYMGLQLLLLTFQYLFNLTLQFALLLLKTLPNVLQSHLHGLLHFCCCAHKVLTYLVPGLVFLHQVRLKL